MSKTAQPTTRLSTLTVPDAETLERFKANAERVWKDAHPNLCKRVGRPSMMGRIFSVLEDALLQGSLGKTPTQGKLIRLVHTHFQRLVQDGLLEAVDAPHEDTIRNYVKMWLLLRSGRADKLSPQEHRWLHKHNPSILQLIELDRAVHSKGKEGTPVRFKSASGIIASVSEVRYPEKIEKMIAEELRKLLPPLLQKARSIPR